MINIDWNAIRSLNGSQADGFEELCAQLARAECSAGLHFVRKGVPDAGVECFAVAGDGSEWGWQAKYFDHLGDRQWPQLDESVKTAIEKHPRLVRYFVCVPLDRSDGRQDGQKSAMDRWDEHARKWRQWAADKGRDVEFVYWGKSELVERLSRPEHIGRIRFWFDARAFDGAWFEARLDEAIRAAGPRYTPEIHVDLPIAKEFDAFGRTDQFFDRLKAQAREIRIKYRAIDHRDAGAVGPPITTQAAALSAKVQTVLDALAAVEYQPTGDLPFMKIVAHVAAALEAATVFGQLLSEHERKLDDAREATPAVQVNAYRDEKNPFRSCKYRVLDFCDVLSEAHDTLTHAGSIAGKTLVILRGTAGTGKTHLLCDLARQRVDAGRPTLLLMGQQFISTNTPWTQALQQLDLAGLSAEEFVGALESAAQVTGSRALFMIDALNEGAGRDIWPSHLGSFLAHLERSKWIAVVLSVRSSYEDVVIPGHERALAVTITHKGFAGYEYDAARTFFAHYRIELTSTPLLSPEFRNPLFLKILCAGLNARGDRRLPRGFLGITAIFGLFLNAADSRLASSLGIDSRESLVRKAIQAFAAALADSGGRSLTLVRAKEVVNALLPGKGFEQSLYQGLVVEGVLLEEIVTRVSGDHEVMVVVAYERFADHLVAKTLLDRHLAKGDPASAFAPGGALAFICDKRKYTAPGLLEALCIQIPERINKEFSDIAPNCVDCQGFREAFWQSLIWRAPEAFSLATSAALNGLIRNTYDLYDSLEVFLTVATLPKHPLNAKFLHQRLIKTEMPERDASWSMYLHHVWGSHSAVDRLVDWSSSVKSDTPVDDETVELCATVLSWMFTSSNRVLRDRATKALVSLLTGRLTSVTRLVELFRDVNDPYVAERVYAAAYGVAMRCHDPVGIALLATSVYSCVFQKGSPPAHILLRDYARGVVERALFLKSSIAIDPVLIRPPYTSQWPEIPDEDDIKSLLPDWSRGSHDSGELEWARNAIASSVMDGDFAHYVIGTNFSTTSRHWLSLRIDEPAPAPLVNSAEDLDTLLEDFSEHELAAWDAFSSPGIENERDSLDLDGEEHIDPKEDDRNTGDVPSSEDGALNWHDAALLALSKDWDRARVILLGSLSSEHGVRLQRIWGLQDRERETALSRRLDLRIIQRYVLWRVFDLGWTTERFGRFDRFDVGVDDRDAPRVERVGKKYQWIAYHEIMALVSDHFKYAEQYSEEETDNPYEGPWQCNLRDIDPSCTLRSVLGGTSWDSHGQGWWCPEPNIDWGESIGSRDWVRRTDDLPRVEHLIAVRNSDNGSRWINVQGYMKWKQRLAPDVDPADVDHREIWFNCTGYLIRSEDVQTFEAWAEGVNFWGNWMPAAPEDHETFLGEHGWAPASLFFHRDQIANGNWDQPERGCPIKVRVLTSEYMRDAGGSDYSVDKAYTLRMPDAELLTEIGIHWTGSGADFVDAEGRLAAFDPTVDSSGPSGLLLREDLWRDYLAKHSLAIVWTVIGEKRVLGMRPGGGRHYAGLRMTGAYALGSQGPTGRLRHTIIDPETR